MIFVAIAAFFIFYAIVGFGVMGVLGYFADLDRSMTDLCKAFNEAPEPKRRRP